MSMRPALRKALLTGHLTVSVGWIGTVVAYIGLAVSAGSSSNAGTVRAAWLGMELVGWYVILPLAIASFISGVLMGAGTKWGLFRHYWVIFSLVLTGFALLVLALHLPTVTATADIARTATPDQLAALGGDLTHPVIGLVVLLVVQVLNLYKPRGMTKYGQSKRPRTPGHDDERTQSSP